MQTRFAEIKADHPAYRIVVIALLILAALGIAAAHSMDSQGHHISGMNNQVVWGLPHVFALMLIVSASGALNLASLSSVFGYDVYKPLSRLSTVLILATSSSRRWRSRLTDDRLPTSGSRSAPVTCSCRTSKRTQQRS